MLMKIINDNNHTPIEYLGSPKNNKKVECIIIKDKEKKRNFSFLFIRTAKNIGNSRFNDYYFFRIFS